MLLLLDVDKSAIKGRDKETDVHLQPKWDQTCSDEKEWNLLGHFKFTPVLWAGKAKLRKNRVAQGNCKLALKHLYKNVLQVMQ